MDKDKDNLWSRRANSSKLSLSMSSSENTESKETTAPRQFPITKRFGDGTTSSHGRSNPFNNIAPLSTSGISSPTAGASSAFGLGSGAFGFKTPKTPGTAFDFGKPSAAAPPPHTPTDKVRSLSRTTSARTITQGKSDATSSIDTSTVDSSASWPLKYTWVIWYRPPTSKPSDYNPKALCEMASAQQFWKVFTHLKRPSALPTVSDYHFFKAGIRPIWEDEENKWGGKWIMRLKKGVADRYWEELLMAMVGDQFAEAGEEVCGAVVSVRSGEDVFSIWTKNDGGRNIKIRETIKRVLSLPPDTHIIWKSHEESSIQTRPNAGNQNRHDKPGQQSSERRRVTLSSDDSAALSEKLGRS